MMYYLSYKENSFYMLIPKNFDINTIVKKLFNKLHIIYCRYHDVNISDIKITRVWFEPFDKLTFKLFVAFEDSTEMRGK